MYVMDVSTAFQFLIDHNRRVRDYFGSRASYQDMAIGLYLVKNYLDTGTESVTSEEVARELDIRYSTATRLLRKHIDRGHLIAVRNEDDQREQTYMLTMEGKAAAEEHIRATEDWVRNAAS